MGAGRVAPGGASGALWKSNRCTSMARAVMASKRANWSPASTQERRERLKQQQASGKISGHMFPGGAIAPTDWLANVLFIHTATAEATAAQQQLQQCCCKQVSPHKAFSTGTIQPTPYSPMHLRLPPPKGRYLKSWVVSFGGGDSTGKRSGLNTSGSSHSAGDLQQVAAASEDEQSKWPCQWPDPLQHVHTARGL